MKKKIYILKIKYGIYYIHKRKIQINMTSLKKSDNKNMNIINNKTNANSLFYANTSMASSSNSVLRVETEQKKMSEKNDDTGKKIKKIKKTKKTTWSSIVSNNIGTDKPIDSVTNTLKDSNKKEKIDDTVIKSSKWAYQRDELEKNKVSNVVSQNGFNALKEDDKYDEYEGSYNECMHSRLFYDQDDDVDSSCDYEYTDDSHDDTYPYQHDGIDPMRIHEYVYKSSIEPQTY